MPDLWAASLLQLLITLDNTLLIMYEFLRVYPEANTHSAIPITKRKKKTRYLMAETAAAGSVAERTAAVCACNKPGFAAKVRSRCRSLSRFLSVISLYLILLNRCSSKLRCSVSPFGHKRSPKPGSQERHHFLPGGGCLSSQKRLDPLWLAPRLPSGSLMLAERRGLSCSAERPANGGAGVPVSSPPAKQSTACL